MIVLRKGGEDALRERMTEAHKSGELPEDTNPTDFARFLSTVIAGLGVQAANGATRVEMKRTADFILRALRMASVPTVHSPLDHGSDVAVLENHAFALALSSDDNLQHGLCQVVGPDHLVGKQDPKNRVAGAEELMSSV